MYPDRVTHLVLEDPLGSVTSPRSQAAAAQDIPRATRVVIPDCGHIPHLEHPSQFLAELRPFLAS